MNVLGSRTPKRERNGYKMKNTGKVAGDEVVPVWMVMPQNEFNSDVGYAVWNPAK